MLLKAISIILQKTACEKVVYKIAKFSIFCTFELSFSLFLSKKILIPSHT